MSGKRKLRAIVEAVESRLMFDAVDLSVSSLSVPQSYHEAPFVTTTTEPTPFIFGATISGTDEDLPISVSYYLSKDSKLSDDDTLVDQVQYTQPGETEDEFYPTSGGRYFLIAKVTSEQGSDQIDNISVAGPFAIFIDDGIIANSSTDVTSVPVAGQGETIQAHVWVNSVRSGPATSADIYLSADTIPGNADDIFLATATLTPDSSSSELIGSLESTSEAIAPVTIPSNIAPGNYHLVAIADGVDPALGSALQIIPQSEEKPQLSFVSFDPHESFNQLSGNVYPGNTTGVDFNLTNSGTLDSGPFNVDVYLSPTPNLTSNRILVSQYSVQNLAPGATEFDLAGVDIPGSIQSGTYYPIMVLDDGNQVAEQDESNHVVMGDALQVEPPFQLLYTPPDSIAPINKGVSTDDAVNPTTTETKTLVGKYSLQVYFSTDQTLSPDDILLTSKKVKTTWNSSLAFSYRLPARTPVGSGYLLAHLTRSGSSEDNVVLSKAITVAPPVPDLTVTANIIPASLAKSHPIFRVTVTNNGLVSDSKLENFEIDEFAGGVGRSILNFSRLVNLKPRKKKIFLVPCDSNSLWPKAEFSADLVENGAITITPPPLVAGLNSGLNLQSPH